MGDNKKWTRRAAVGSLATGAGLLLFGTGGSTQITSYRDVEANVAGEDENALLEFVDVSGDASVVKPDGSEIIYEIRDNVGAFDRGGISVDARVVGGETVDTSVSGDTDVFDVKVKCSDGASGLRGPYEIDLDFTVSNSSNTITATRTTGVVEFDCYDFGNSNNYRDSGNKGAAAQPDPNGENPPRGSLKSPENVNDGDDDTYATAKSVCNSDESEGSGDNKGGRVGYALPSVRQGSKYELDVVYKNSNGSWNVYLVDIDGNELTQKTKLTGGGQKVRTEPITFTGTEASDISGNADSLYLIFETTSSGNCVSVDVNSFELRKTESNAN